MFIYLYLCGFVHFWPSRGWSAESVMHSPYATQFWLDNRELSVFPISACVYKNERNFGGYKWIPVNENILLSIWFCSCNSFINWLFFRGGIELRVWKAIVKWRKEHRPGVTPPQAATDNNHNQLWYWNDSSKCQKCKTSLGTEIWWHHPTSTIYR